VFDSQGTEISETVDARKQPISREGAWDLLKGAKEIVIGKGKKFLKITPSAHSREEILENCLGRSGTLRAPALKIGNRFIIGFNDDMYREYLGR